MVKDPGNYRPWIREFNKFRDHVPWPKEVGAYNRIKSEVIDFYRLIPLEKVPLNAQLGTPLVALYYAQPEIGLKAISELLTNSDLPVSWRTALVMFSVNRFASNSLYPQAKKLMEDVLKIDWLDESRFMEFARYLETIKSPVRTRYLAALWGIRTAGKFKGVGPQRVAPVYLSYVASSSDLCAFEEVERVGGFFLTRLKPTEDLSVYLGIVYNVARAQRLIGKETEARKTLDLASRFQGRQQDARAEFFDLDMLKAQFLVESGSAAQARSIYEKYKVGAEPYKVELGFLDELKGNSAAALSLYQAAWARVEGGFAERTGDVRLLAHMLRLSLGFSRDVAESYAPLLRTWSKEPPEMGDALDELNTYISMAQYFYTSRDPAGLSNLLKRFDTQYMDTGCLRYRSHLQAWSQALQTQGLAPDGRKIGADVLAKEIRRIPIVAPENLNRSTLLTAIQMKNAVK